MCDTFHPLKLTKLAKELDEPDYAYSWYEEPGESHVRPGPGGGDVTPLRRPRRLGLGVGGLSIRHSPPPPRRDRTEETRAHG